MELENVTNRVLNRRNDQNKSEVRKNEAVTEDLSDNVPPSFEKEMKQHIQIWLKMYAENKINMSNIRNIKIIDYMKYLLDSQGLNKHSLQTVANSLDTCAKVYHFKVEYLYNTLQLLHMGKALTSTKGKTVECAQDQRERRKRFNAKIVKNSTSLLGDIPKLETNFFQMHTNPDSSPVDNLFTNKLITDYRRYRFMHLSQEKAWPSFETKEDCITKYAFKLASISNFEICAPLCDFEIEQEEDENRVFTENRLSMEEMNEVVYDDCGFPIPNLDRSSDLVKTGESVKQLENICVTRNVKHLTNFMPYECGTRPDEYCFARLSLSNKPIRHVWVGPSHWKLKYIRQMNPMSSNIQKQKRKRGTKSKTPLINFHSNNAPFDKSNQLDSSKRRKISLPPYKCTLPLRISTQCNNRFLMSKPVSIDFAKRNKTIWDVFDNNNSCKYQDERVFKMQMKMHMKSFKMTTGHLIPNE